MAVAEQTVERREEGGRLCPGPGRRAQLRLGHADKARLGWEQDHGAGGSPRDADNEQIGNKLLTFPNERGI